MNNASWWDQKLANPGRSQVSTPPVYPQSQMPVAPAYVPPVASAPLPQSAVNMSRCPGCGSGNYGSSPLTPEARARCYDCGYPIQQSGSGAAGINQGQASGPAQAARQVASGGWNPNVIVDRIG